MNYELLFFDTSEYKMNNIKYYYAIFSRTIKKTKCVSLYFTHHSFFSFYRGKNHLKIIFIFNKLVRIFHTVHFAEQFKFNILFFFFHTPIQSLIAIVSRVTIIYVPFSPRTRRSTFLLITREHSGAFNLGNRRDPKAASYYIHNFLFTSRGTT